MPQNKINEIIFFVVALILSYFVFGIEWYLVSANDEMAIINFLLQFQNGYFISINGFGFLVNDVTVGIINNGQGLLYIPITTWFFIGMQFYLIYKILFNW